VLLGVVDPLEDLFSSCRATGLVALGALVGKSRYRKLLYVAFGLVTSGGGALWVLGVFGGLGAALDGRTAGRRFCFPTESAG
jgi:hypothetical protein